MAFFLFTYENTEEEREEEEEEEVRSHCLKKETFLPTSWICEALSERDGDGE